MRLIALRAFLDRDNLDRYYRQSRSGFMVFTEGGTEEEIDSVAISLSRLTMDKVFILKPEAFSARKEVHVAAATSLGYSSIRVRRAGDPVSSVSHPVLDCTYRADYPSITAKGFLESASSLIHVGIPRSPILLFPYIQGVVHEREVVELSKLSDLVAYLGECSDSMQLLSGCSTCAEETCYKLPFKDYESLVYRWLEEQEGYLRPSQYDSMFTPRRIERENLRSALDWDNVDEISETRSKAAKKSAIIRAKKKSDCVKCVEGLRSDGYYGSLTCREIHSCSGPRTVEEVREAMKAFSKSRGLATSYRSYLGQANIHLAGTGVTARVDGGVRQYWNVAYVYDSRKYSPGSELVKVAPYYTDLDVSKIPSYLHVLLYKSGNAYEGWRASSVRLKDLLLGLVAYTGLQPTHYLLNKDKWRKVPSDLVLMHNILNVMPTARLLSSTHSKHREYLVYLRSYNAIALPTTTARVVVDFSTPGNPYAVTFLSDRPSKQQSFHGYYEWAMRSRMRLKSIEDLFKETYTHKGNVSTAILESE